MGEEEESDQEGEFEADLGDPARLHEQLAQIKQQLLIVSLQI